MRKHELTLWIVTAAPLLLSCSRNEAQVVGHAPTTPSIQSLRVMAERGDPFGEYMLGYRYETGLNVAQSYSKAAALYRKAADQGYAAAQYSLGLLYLHNQGVPQDYRKAYFWLNLASSAYSDKSEGSLERNVVSARNSAAQHLTKSSLLEVQKEVEQFLLDHPQSY